MISPTLNNLGDDTFNEPDKRFHDWTDPDADFDETISPFSKSLISISTPNLGNHFSGIILPEEFASSKLPGMLPSKRDPSKLYLTVPNVPPMFGSVARILNRL